MKDKKAVIYLSNMVTIEYNGHKVNVPTSWDEVTVGDYEAFYLDKPDTARERVALVAKICKTEVDILLGWPADAFNIIVEKIGFLFKDNPAEPNPSVEVDGVTYVVPIEDKLSLGAYVDADEVQKGDEAVISNLLAIVCRPAGEEYNYENNETRAAMFAALPVSKVQGVLAFFLHCKHVLDERTKAFTNLAQVVGSLPLSIRGSRRLGGGIKLSQTWRAMRYYALMMLLNWRLRKLLRSYNIDAIKITPKRHKGS